jgi:hypothetical protein
MATDPGRRSRPDRHLFTMGLRTLRRSCAQDRPVTFLLGSTWLALNIWIAEHGIMIAAATLCMTQPAYTRLRQPARGTGTENSTAPRRRSIVGHSTGH